jgi:hypothetical protein
VKVFGRVTSVIKSAKEAITSAQPDGKKGESKIRIVLGGMALIFFAFELIGRK